MGDVEDNDVTEVRPIELETHRITPPPLCEEALAEISQLSAEIEEAENFELTFEVVEQPTDEEPEEVDYPDPDVQKILTPAILDRKSRLPPVSGLEEEAPEETDAHTLATSEKKPVLKRKLGKQGGETATPPSRKRKSVAEDIKNIFSAAKETSPSQNDENTSPPGHQKLLKSVADKLTEEFESPTTRRQNRSIAESIGDIFSSPKSKKK